MFGGVEMTPAKTYIECSLSGQIPEGAWQEILNERKDIKKLYEGVKYG